jgi:hypothetical protein
MAESCSTVLHANAASSHAAIGNSLADMLVCSFILSDNGPFGPNILGVLSFMLTKKAAA